MSLEFENAISIQPLENSGSGLQFQNTIYIQPKGEGGDTPTGVGKVYISTGEEFTGTTFSEELNLLEPSGTAISNFPLTQPFKLIANNVVINNNSSYRAILAYETNPAAGSFSISCENGIIELWTNFPNKIVKRTIMSYTNGNSYDLEIENNGSGTNYARAKLSSNTTFQEQSYTYTLASGSIAKNVTVGNTDTLTNIENVKVISNGNTLFERT